MILKSSLSSISILSENIEIDSECKFCVPIVALVISAKHNLKNSFPTSILQTLFARKVYDEAGYKRYYEFNLVKR